MNRPGTGLRTLVVALVCGFACTVPSRAGVSDSSQQQTYSTAQAAPPAVTPVVGRRAASPIPLRAGALMETATGAGDVVGRRDEHAASQAVYLAIGGTALLGFNLLESLLVAFLQTAVGGSRRPALRTSGAPSGPITEAEYEAKCQQLFQTINTRWRQAQAAVVDLDEALPLRALLYKELKQISQRLAMDPGLQTATAGALTSRHDVAYWKAMSQRLNQSARDLHRIGAVAEAAGAGFGNRNREPRIPSTRDEACFILGANREADAETLQRLVKALRQCWHPDLAQSDADRRHREARIKQINAAHDLITGKRAEG